jgi:hypothetical protein
MFSVESSYFVSMTTEVSDAATWRTEKHENVSEQLLLMTPSSGSRNHWPCSKLMQEQKQISLSLSLLLNHKVFLEMGKKKHLKGQFPFQIS